MAIRRKASQATERVGTAAQGTRGQGIRRALQARERVGDAATGTRKGRSRVKP